jgi:hypothetical protein
LIANIRAAVRPRLRRTIMAGAESVMVRREQRKEKAEGFRITRGSGADIAVKLYHLPIAYATHSRGSDCGRWEIARGLSFVIEI